MPAVVNINTERIVQRQVRDSADELFNYFYGPPASAARRPADGPEPRLGFLVDALACQQ